MIVNFVLFIHLNSLPKHVDSFSICKSRYNEHDQLVCRVCDVVVKSESHWPAHQASRKHHEVKSIDIELC